MMRLVPFVLVLVALGVTAGAETPQTVERWGVFELILEGPRDGNAFVDVEVSADFTSGDHSVRVTGFYDGDGTYRARFMPDRLGEWSYRTASSAPALDGQTGTFTCTPATAGNHGPVKVRGTFHFAYADGSPYRQIGTTSYAWIHQTRELQEQTLETLAASPFNKMRMCVFPKDYVYNQNEPEFYPWSHLPDFDALTFLKSGVAPRIDLEPATREDDFGLVFQGLLDVPEDAVYTFTATSDDGSRLIVDGQVVVDNDGEHAPVPKTGQVGLAKGLHEIRVEFFERAGGQALEVVWSSPTIDPQPIPAERLLHRAE